MPAQGVGEFRKGISPIKNSAAQFVDCRCRCHGLVRDRHFANMARLTEDKTSQPTEESAETVGFTSLPRFLG